MMHAQQRLQNWEDWFESSSLMRLWFAFLRIQLITGMTPSSEAILSSLTIHTGKQHCSNVTVNVLIAKKLVFVSLLLSQNCKKGLLLYLVLKYIYFTPLKAHLDPLIFHPSIINPFVSQCSPLLWNVLLTLRWLILNVLHVIHNLFCRSLSKSISE